MIVVPKTDSKRFEEPPLSWHPGWAKDHPIAIFTCPGGSTGSLHDWTIAADGTVSPSVDCRCGCGFHDFIRLEGWDAEWLPRRADSQPRATTPADSHSWNQPLAKLEDGKWVDPFVPADSQEDKT